MYSDNDDDVTGVVRKLALNFAKVLTRAADPRARRLMHRSA